MLLLLVALQAAQAPDIEFNANVRARQVAIEKQGDARLTVTTSPDAGDNRVEVQAPRANGRKTLRNVDVSVRARARIGDPQNASTDNLAQAEARLPE
jgi:hypothetical protein